MTTLDWIAIGLALCIALDLIFIAHETRADRRDRRSV
jgi:hypothetical protein